MLARLMYLNHRKDHCKRALERRGKGLVAISSKISEKFLWERECWKVIWPPLLPAD